MKNKDIEELLNELKDNIPEDYIRSVDTKEGIGRYELDINSWQYKLLSYIEQLEKRNKELYEGFMATQEELTDYATKNEQLEADYKEANESVIWWTNRYNAIVKQNDDNHKKVVKLENNRDKAIEYIKEEQICEKHEGGYTHQGEDYYVLYNSDVLLNILKGDSE